ncbi:MAG TPA: TlpA disulfide reductase family protein [Flavobacterium sp.]|nr:TlpA disulfide reductase family protein [Flavobacterium sp.]
MRHLILALFGSLLIVSCNKNGYTIEGEAKGVKDGTEIVLQKQDSTGIVRLDTVKVKDGKFAFEGETEGPGLHQLTLKDNPSGGAVLILEPGDIKVTLDKDTIYKSRVSGTFNNDELAAYLDKDIKIRNKQQAFAKQNMARYQEAMMKKDTVTVNQIQAEGQKMYKEHEKLAKEQVKSNPKAFISVLLLTQFLNAGEKEMPFIEKSYNNLDAPLKETQEGKRIKKAIDRYKKDLEAQKNTSIGNKAPDFKAKNAAGQEVSLYSSLGKVTIVDFWASWCPPCRKEAPAMVSLYNEFHSAGLNIVGVSLDGDKAAWLKAIETDKRTWTDLSNLKSWEDPVARMYALRSIPTIIVLDAKGMIVAKDLHGEELRAKVAELLGATK